MIRSDKEYHVARTRLGETKQAIVQQRIEYAEMGLDIATANMFIGSTLAQQQQIQDEIVEYKNARAFKLDDYSFKATLWAMRKPATKAGHSPQKPSHARSTRTGTKTV